MMYRLVVPHRFVWPNYVVLALFLVMLALTGCQSRTNRQSPVAMPQSLSKRLIVPVQGVRARDLRDTWGAARANGRRHEGIDIFADAGTPIFSTTVGVVQKISTGGAGGRAIRIAGPANSSHYYAHLQRFADLKQGDRVEVGTLLGTVGNSGNAAGGRPHLHYGIYLQDGKAVNPYLYLVR